MSFLRTVSASLAFGLAICFPAFSQQTTPVFGTVRTADDDSVKRTTVSIEGPGGCCSSVTTDTGQFNFSVPPLEIGYPYTFHVESWVVVDPCVLARGRVYLPNPKAEKIAIKVLARGDARIKSPESVACIVVEEASRFKPQMTAPKGPQSLLQNSSSAIFAQIFKSDLPLLRGNHVHVIETAYRPEPVWTQAKPAATERVPDQPVLDTFLEKQAKELGLTPQQLASAIDEWSKSTTNAYERGLAAFHKGRYLEARKYISDSIKSPKGDILEHYVTLGRVEYETGHYPAAEAALRKVLAVHKDDPLVLTNLGLVLMEQARFAESETLHKRALVIDEAILGPNQPDVAEILRNLAELYATVNKFTEAERLLQRAIAINEKALGSDDPQTVKFRGYLGMVHLLQGDPNAEQLLKDALAMDEKVLGPDHPDVAEVVAYLAIMYWHQGRNSEVEPLLKRALAIQEKSVGLDHPSVAILLTALALFQKTQDNHAVVEPALKRALAIQEKALGTDHPDVADVLLALAVSYALDLKLDDSESLLKRALAIKEKALGPASLDLVNILTILSGLYEAEEKWADALQLSHRALSILKKSKGPTHPDVAEAAEHIALCLHKLGRDAEAKPYEYQAAEIRAKLKQKAKDPAPKKP